MKKSDSDKITSILEDIKSNTTVVGTITEFRDVHKIWELGLLVKEIIGITKNSGEQNRKIVRDFDWKILGKKKSWSDYAYDWVISFQEKEYFLKICKYAGFRDGKNNRFRKRDLRYLVSIYSKNSSSTLSDAKRKKLENQIANDSILALSAEEFHKIIVDIKGREYVQWEKIRDSIRDLQYTVESITNSLDDVDKRKKFRDELGETLISQLSAAMQLCVISKKSDYEYGYTLANKQEFKKKSKSKNKEFLELFEKLKGLLKDFELKHKLIPESEYYELEQSASYLDALQTEDDFKEFYERKKELSSVFR